MAFRLVRLKREARRNAKLEEIFMEKDKGQTGTIAVDTVAEIFRMYEVRLDEAVIQKVASEDGNFISKEDFIKVCQDQKLLDFGGPMGEKRKHTTVTPRKEREIEPDANYDGLGWLCCCGSRVALEDKRRQEKDKVMIAFTIWDTDGDGYLSWEEFQKISNNTCMSQEQALRIFQHCDKTGRGKVTLAEFRAIAESRPGAGTVTGTGKGTGTDSRSTSGCEELSDDSCCSASNKQSSKYQQIHYN